MKKITIILLISGLFIHTAMAIPAMINYRGKLFQSGMPVTGSRNIDFRIFNVSTGGIALWSSGYQSVEVNNGYYHYTLGKNVVIDPIIFTNAALYLEVEIQGAGGALDPRERIVSVGYALNAHMVNGQHSTNLNYWSKNTNNVYRLTGNFGLGALPGSHRLTVGGASSFWDDLYLNQNDLYDAYSFSISPDDDAQTGIKFENALSAIKGSLEYTFNDPPGNTFLFRNCGKLGISISSNGYVGIGSSTPIEQLEITENFRMPLTTTASGIIYAGANRFIHNYGIGNTFLGLNSGVLSGTGANYNIGIGENTLDNLSTGDYNIGIGVNALSSINTGLRNIGIGYYALFNNTAGQYNTCIGHNAGYQAMGNYNTFVGSYAGDSSAGSSASYNVGVGYYTGYNLSTGEYNSLLGTRAGQNISTGYMNTLLGYSSGRSITTGNSNTIIGMQAGDQLITGSRNVFIGHFAGFNETGSAKLYIDNSSTSSPLIWGDFSADIVNINGSMGINDSTPSYTLDVAGEASFDGALRARDATGIGFYDDAGNTGVWVEDGGFVGLGTVNPGQRLDVDTGNINLDYGYRIMWDTLNNSIRGENGAMFLRVGMVDSFKITSQGRVSIGSFEYTNSWLNVSYNMLTPIATIASTRPDATKQILKLEFKNDDTLGTSDDFIVFHNSLGEVGNIHSEVVYGTFTGSHDGQTDEDSGKWEKGMLLISSGETMPNKSMGRALVKVELAKKRKDKAIMGVFVYAEFPHNVSGFDKTKPAITYNALGEGLILVTDTNGDIEVGDLITTSNRPGYGEKQDDDLFHNYTAAKATEPVDWEKVKVDPKKGFKWKLIACTYHSG